MMRAKMRVWSVDKGNGFESLKFSAVCRNEGYPSDGSDENNTFAKWTPSADLNILVNNPDLFDKFQVGQEFYLDFTEAN